MAFISLTQNRIPARNYGSMKSFFDNILIDNSEKIVLKKQSKYCFYNASVDAKNISDRHNTFSSFGPGIFGLKILLNLVFRRISNYKNRPQMQ
jgi:hypothetical protein